MAGSIAVSVGQDTVGFRLEDSDGTESIQYVPQALRHFALSAALHLKAGETLSKKSNIVLKDSDITDITIGIEGSYSGYEASKDDSEAYGLPKRGAGRTYLGVSIGAQHRINLDNRGVLAGGTIGIGNTILVDGSDGDGFVLTPYSGGTGVPVGGHFMSLNMGAFAGAQIKGPLWLTGAFQLTNPLTPMFDDGQLVMDGSLPVKFHGSKVSVSAQAQIQF